MEVKKHKHGKTVRFTTQSSTTFIHCQDLFSILGVDWNSRKVKNCCTKKFRCPDRSAKMQPQTFLASTSLEQALARSKRLEKVAWLREVFLGVKPARTPQEEKVQTPAAPPQRQPGSPT